MRPPTIRGAPTRYRSIPKKALAGYTIDGFKFTELIGNITRKKITSITAEAVGVIPS
jgi:hypothetical protein